MNTETDSDTRCFVCGDDNTNALQTHHIVPRRHGGTDKDENLVKLCANCHQAVERLYNKRFYRKLGVADRDKAPGRLLNEILDKCESGAETAVGAYEDCYEPFPELEERDLIIGQMVDDLGHGEFAGYSFGYYDAMTEIRNMIEDTETE